MLDVLDRRRHYLIDIAVGSRLPTSVLLIHAAIETSALASSVGVDFEGDRTKETVITVYNECRPVIRYHRKYRDRLTRTPGMDGFLRLPNVTA